MGSLEPAEAESGRLGEDDATVAVGVAVGGTAVRWYRHLDNAGPAGADGMLLLLANEYWDAQPARQFQWVAGRGWCEVCVDINREAAAGDARFKLVLSPQVMSDAGIFSTTIWPSHSPLQMPSSLLI